MFKRLVCILLVMTMLFSVFAATMLESSAIAPLPHRVQFDEPWGSVKVGYGTISATGCGILALVNAVGYLTGKEMDIIETAQWAYSVNGFNNIEDNLGTYRLVLYPKVQEQYGEEYGFTVDCNTEGNGWWAGANSKVLKDHLANGGVAIGNIPGHFIAIVDYNATTNMFHVLDSYPTASRGTSENRGDVWLSESHMSTGDYKLSWFCLLSAVGTPADEQDNEREFLGNAIEAAKNIRFYNFNAEELNTFRSAYATAVSVYKSESSASEDCTAARTALVSAMNANNAISLGKSYTATPNERTDIYKDDGKKLTDGNKGQLPANTDVYSGLGNHVDSVITIDLGANPSAHNTYRVFAATNGNWGIGTPATIKVSVSSDGTNFKEVATTSTAWSVANNGDWTSYVLNLQAESNRTERYVRFTITPNGHTWIDEVEVCGGTPVDVDGVYITATNKRISSGECNLFTSGFGDFTVHTANYLYTHNLILKWNESEKAYEVTFSGFGKAIEAVRGEKFTLAGDELLIAAHDWESGVTSDIVYGSGTNFKAVQSTAVGDLVTLSGIDVENGTCSAAAYFSITHTNPIPNPNLAYQKDYVTSEIYSSNGNALYPDENGISLTDGIYAQAKGDFSDAAFVGFNVNSDDYKTNGYSSVTVDLSDVYSVKKMVVEVASSYHDSVGINAPSMIEVYVSSDNNTFKKVGYANPVDSDKRSAVSVEIALSKAVDARYVQFRFTGKTSWIFVTEVEVYSYGSANFYGDVNADEKIDSLDYLLVKRAGFGTYELGEEEQKRADVNSDTKVDSSDYLLVKRIAFDTYITATIQPDIPEEDEEIEDTPQAPEIEIPDISNDATYTNVALNKTYTKSNLHPVDNPSYPDENNKTMTDGVRASSTASYSDAAFMAFSRSSFDYNANGYSSITVDLGSIHYVDKFVVSTASAKFSKYGIDAPAYVWIYVSNDGNEWYRVGTTTHVDSTSVSTVDCTLKLSKAVSARYVQYRICCNAGGWMFISEVETFGVKAEQAVTHPQRTADKKILFVGNSTTFFFNIPDKLFFLGQAAGMEIDVEYCCGGGAYLYHYADSTTALGKLFRTKLALKDYDYVVLQDNGNATYDDSKPALDVLVPLIEQTGAEVLLYKRYSSNSDPSQRPASAYRHEQNYTKLASTFGIEKVAPVADAFLICTEKYPSINLYHTDNSHHNATAAYLVACVFAITYLDMDITNNTYTAGLDAATVKALKECAKIACEQGYNYNK